MNAVLKLWVLVFTIYAPLVYASSLGVWPINPRIDAPASATLVWVKNNNKTEPVVLQARIFLWHQTDNTDESIPQDDLVVSPPIIDVQPDAQQIFRVMNRNGVIQDVNEEKSYRLLIDEVPKEGENQGSTLRFQMRYSLPLFVGLPKEYSNISLNDRLKKMASNIRYRLINEPSPFIEIINRSPLHARLSNLSVSNNNNLPTKKIIVTGLLGYVLPNSTKRWPLNKEQLDVLQQQNMTLTFEQEHQELKIADDK